MAEIIGIISIILLAIIFGAATISLAVVVLICVYAGLKTIKEEFKRYEDENH